jgi:hypothetical protein
VRDLRHTNRTPQEIARAAAITDADVERAQLWADLVASVWLRALLRAQVRQPTLRSV